MPYDEKLAERIRTQFKGVRGVTERKMFGGVCFMLRGNMVCGVEKNSIIIRVGPEKYESALKKPNARPLDFTGRPLKGFIYVAPSGIKTAATLKKWVDQGIKFAITLPPKIK